MDVYYSCGIQYYNGLLHKLYRMYKRQTARIKTFIKNFINNTFCSANVLLSICASIILVSCTDISAVIYRGTEEELFKDTSVKLINTPLLIQIIWVIVYTCLSSVSVLVEVRHTKRKHNQKRIRKAQIYDILIGEAIIYVTMLSITALFCGLAIVMEIIQWDTMYKFFFVSQAFFAIISALTIGSNNGKASGRKLIIFNTMDKIRNAIINKTLGTLGQTIEKDDKKKD